MKRSPRAGDRLVDVSPATVEVLSVEAGRVRYREERRGQVQVHDVELAEWYRRHAFTPGRPGWWVSA